MLDCSDDPGRPGERYDLRNRPDRRRKTSRGAGPTSEQQPAQSVPLSTPRFIDDRSVSREHCYPRNHRDLGRITAAPNSTVPTSEQQSQLPPTRPRARSAPDGTGDRADCRTDQDLTHVSSSNVGDCAASHDSCASFINPELWYDADSGSS